MEISKFDVSKMQENRRAVIIAKTGSGKSFLVQDIMYYKRHIPCGVVLSGTEDGNAFYGQYVPDLYVHSSYDEDVVREVLNRQKRLTHAKVPNRGCFIIMDDCVYDKKILKTDLMREIFMNGRHYGAFCLLTMQYMNDMPPPLRTNTDYVFLLRETSLQNRKKLYETFAGMFKSFKEFCAVMDALTEDYGCLVIDNTVTSNDLTKQVFWYKAEAHPPYKIGCPMFWQKHKKRYNPEYYEDECKGTRKNRASLRIKKKS